MHSGSQCLIVPKRKEEKGKAELFDARSDKWGKRGCSGLVCDESTGFGRGEGALEILDGLKRVHPQFVQQAALLEDKSYCVADFPVEVEDWGL